MRLIRFFSSHKEVILDMGSHEKIIGLENMRNNPIWDKDIEWR